MAPDFYVCIPKLSELRCSSTTTLLVTLCRETNTKVVCKGPTEGAHWTMQGILSVNTWNHNEKKPTTQNLDVYKLLIHCPRYPDTSLPLWRLYEDGDLLSKELFPHVGTFERLWVTYWKIRGAFIPKIHLRLTSFNYVWKPYFEVRYLYFRLKIHGVE